MPAWQPDMTSGEPLFQKELPQKNRVPCVRSIVGTYTHRQGWRTRHAGQGVLMAQRRNLETRLKGGAAATPSSQTMHTARPAVQAGESDIRPSHRRVCLGPAQGSAVQRSRTQTARAHSYPGKHSFGVHAAEHAHTRPVRVCRSVGSCTQPRRAARVQLGASWASGRASKEASRQAGRLAGKQASKHTKSKHAHGTTAAPTMNDGDAPGCHPSRGPYQRITPPYEGGPLFSSCSDGVSLLLLIRGRESSGGQRRRLRACIDVAYEPGLAASQYGP